MRRTFEDLLVVNRAVAALFDDHNRRTWGPEVLVIELAKQVGDLSRAVLTRERYYLQERDSMASYRSDDDRIADELADIFYCVIRLADHYGIDLEQAHLAARGKEWAHL